MYFCPPIRSPIGFGLFQLICSYAFLAPAQVGTAAMASPSTATSATRATQCNRFMCATPLPWLTERKNRNDTLRVRVTSFRPLSVMIVGPRHEEFWLQLFLKVKEDPKAADGRPDRRSTPPSFPALQAGQASDDFAAEAPRCDIPGVRCVFAGKDFGWRPGQGEESVDGLVASGWTDSRRRPDRQRRTGHPSALGQCSRAVRGDDRGSHLPRGRRIDRPVWRKARVPRRKARAPRRRATSEALPESNRRDCTGAVLPPRRSGPARCRGGRRRRAWRARSPGCPAPRDTR